MVADRQSRVTFLAADLLSAAQPSPTPLPKTRVRGFRRHASGRLSRRGRSRSMFTPGSRTCAYKTASGLGKWLSRDPIGERGGINLYAFLNNNVLNNEDRLGLCTPGVKQCNCKTQVTVYDESPTTQNAISQMPSAYTAAEVAVAASEGVGASSTEGVIASGTSAGMGSVSGSGNLAEQAVNVTINPGPGRGYAAWTFFTTQECESRSCINPWRWISGKTYWGPSDPTDTDWEPVSVDQYHSDGMGAGDLIGSQPAAQAAADTQCAKQKAAFHTANPGSTDF